MDALFGNAAMGKGRLLFAGVLGALMLGLSGFAGAAVSVHTEKPTYVIAPGQEFDIRVFLDADDALVGDQALDKGLFSFGVKLVFDPLKLSIAGVSGITAPSALNFNGFNAGALRQVGTGFAGVKGNINQNVFEVYEDTLIATFRVKDLSGGGTYGVGLQLHKTLGDSEQLFLDGDGNVLDGGASFVGAQVTAVPEPSIALMLGAGMGVLGVLARRRRK